MDAYPGEPGDAKPPVLTVRKDSGAAMNTSKEVVMKTVKSGVFSVLLAIQLMPLWAQSFEVNPPMVQSATPQRISSVVYTSGLPGDHGLASDQRMEVASGEAASGFVDGTSRPLRLKLFRIEGLSFTNSRSNMLLRDDQASYMVRAPTPTVNKALSLVSTIYQAEMDSTVTRWVQVLSLASTRRINAEFVYSARISRNSSLDSVISCSLHPDAGSGMADVVAHIQYAIRF